MESCADSNVGERELATSQGDAAKRDPPSELSFSAEAQVHVGGGKCTQVPVVSLAQCFVFVRRQPYFVSRIIPYNETDTDADSLYIYFPYKKHQNVPATSPSL